ncbi:MAG: hypothetical protein QOG65_246 [Actinomycetota bacterium]|jgi:uncharacterized protein (DUF302 family)|nr:hypothetical protein [Actinomycetota bacterium]
MTPNAPGSNDHTPSAHTVSGVVTLERPGGVDELLRRVLARVESLGLDLFTVIDHSGKADEVGLTMPDTKVIMFGNPRVGTPLMRAHPLIALDLPLKLLIWAGDDDRAFLSYNAPGYLAERFDLSSREAAAVRVVEDIARAVVAD